MDDEEEFDISKVVDNVNGVECVNIKKHSFDGKNVCMCHSPPSFNIKEKYG